MKRSLSTLIGSTLIAAAVFLAAAASRASDSVNVQTFPTHSRLSFSVESDVQAQFSPKPKGFEIFFKGITLSDLGAPLGEEEEWKNQFARFGDTRLQSLRFSEVPGGVKIDGTWKFPKGLHGEDVLVNPKMETFDFRQGADQAGSAYVLDFWLKKGNMTVSEFKLHQKERERLAKMRQNEEAKRLMAQRRLASEKRKEEVEDTTRFCREPLDEKKDIFLQFYPIHKKVEFKRWFPTNTPDEYLAYEEPPSDAPDVKDTKDAKTDDARYVRLALDLYRHGKVALALKTLDFFESEHPDSRYRTWMKFLRANAMIKLGLNRDAEQILKDLVTDAKDSPVALHSAMFLAERQMERNDPLAATETFLGLIAHFPLYEHAWLFHLGAAENLFALRQMDRALKEYEWVAEKAPDAASKAEGALRMPDLFVMRFQYDEALAAYYQAIRSFPEQAKDFPSVYVNRAEALYGLGQFDRARQAFQDFVKDFPIDPAGWRATFRLGEIEGRKPGEASESASRDWFYETINRYPFSPGATLARLRLIPCGDHGGFAAAGAERFFTEDVPGYDPKSEVNLVPFHAMATLAHVRALIAFRKETDAVGLATDELRKPGNLELHSILGATLGSVFRKSILGLLAQGRKYEALSFYKDKSVYLSQMTAQTTAPGSGDPDETDYLLKLSEAASDLGLGGLAKEISDQYAKANASRALADSSAPDLESLLASSEAHFTEAKALWVSSGMKEEASIRAHLSQVREESPYSYQRELILGLMDEKSKASKAALTHAIRAQMLRPVAAAASDLNDQRVTAWIADLQAEAGEGPSAWQAALEMERELERHIRLASKEKAPAQVDEVAAAIGIPAMPQLDAVILAQGSLLEKLGQWGEAAGTYARAVDEKIGGNEALYQYARSLRKTGKAGDATQARAVLEKLASSKANEDFWMKLAREALADETMVPRP